MALELNGTTGVSAVQAGAVESGDLPAGSVIQVVSHSFSSATIIASTSYQNVNNSSVSITPKSTASKILILANPQCFVRDDGTGSVDGDIRILKNSAELKEFTRALFLRATSSGIANLFGGNILLKFLDSPNTTSTITYSLESKVSETTNTRLIAFNEESANTSSMTLMEIAG